MRILLLITWMVFSLPSMGIAAGGEMELDQYPQFTGPATSSDYYFMVDAGSPEGGAKLFFSGLATDWINGQGDWSNFSDDVAANPAVASNTIKVSSTDIGVAGFGYPKLGESSSSAYRGDRGLIAYTHSQSPHPPSGAEINVQSDWDQVITSADDFIKNKPDISGVMPPGSDGQLIQFVGTTPTAVDYLTNIGLNMKGAQINLQFNDDDNFLNDTETDADHVFSAAKILAIISDKDEVTAASDDLVLIGDTSDSGNLKKVLVSDFAGSVADDSITAAKMADGSHGEFTYTTNVASLLPTAISNRTEVVAASDDLVLIGDTSDAGNLKKVPVSDFAGSVADDSITAAKMDDGSHGAFTYTTNSATLNTDSVTSDDITNGAIVNADINSGAAIDISKTALVAGRSLTLSTNTVNVDAELYTDSESVYIEDPVAESLDELFYFPNAVTITRVSCTTDTGTATLNLANSTNDVLNSDIVCDADGETSTGINTSYDNYSAATWGDIDIASVASTPGKVSIAITFTIDDV